MMPEMSGMDLHAEITKHFPALAERMIFMTGGAFSGHAQAFLERVSNPCLTKPFDSKQLLSLIQESMSEVGKEGAKRRTISRRPPRTDPFS
jgi:CheY-like chemotaxis protein